MQEPLIKSFMRSEQKNQIPVIFGLTGFDGSEKKIIANLLDNYLFENNHHCYLLSEDDFLDNDLTSEERLERMVWISKKMIKSGIIVIALFNSESLSHRGIIREKLKNDNYIEILFSQYIQDNLYELGPDATIDTSDKSVEVNFKKIISLVEQVDLRP